MRNILKASTVLALLSPFMALAATTGLNSARNVDNTSINWNAGQNQDGLTIFLGKVSKWITYLVVIVIALAMLAFLWGIIQYITAGADEEKRAGARNYMIYGIIGLFVMVSVWALVYWLGSILGIRPGGGLSSQEMPGVPGIGDVIGT